MPKALQTILHECTELVDPRLEAAGVFQHTSAEPMQLKGRKGLLQDLARKEAEIYMNEHGKAPNIFAQFKHIFNTRMAYFSAFGMLGGGRLAASFPYMPDAVYINEKLERKLQRDPEYDALLTKAIAHEITHARTLLRGVLGNTDSMKTFSALCAHPIFESLAEGLADYFAMVACDALTPVYEKTAVDQCVDRRVAMVEGILHQEDFLSAADQVDADARVMCSAGVASYYFGQTFMHIVAKYLSEREAVGLALNPLNPVVDVQRIPVKVLDGDTMQLLWHKGDVDFLKGDALFRVTYNEIKNPWLYVERRLKEDK